jgi:biopolymer transport protein ExbD
MRRKKEFFSPDLTPLIDVVFLLLIFFLVTSVFKQEDKALLLNLPIGENMTSKVELKDVDISLSKDALAFERKIINFEELDTILNKIKERKKLINIRIDKEVKYDRIVKVLDLLKKYHLSNIALVNKEQ